MTTLRFITIFSLCLLSCETITYCQTNTRFPAAPHGRHPVAPLVQGQDGSLYGTTFQGGVNDNGVLFKIRSDHSMKILHVFGGRSKADGARPGALSLSKDGRLFGATGSGGLSDTGMLFCICADGTDFKVLHSFSKWDNQGLNRDGARPEGALVIGRNGSLYGVASVGGKYGHGTLFALHPDGTGFHVLHHFHALIPHATLHDGRYPSGLFQGRDSALYGTTKSGGANESGTVFSIAVDGRGYKVLHSFDPIREGHLDRVNREGTLPLASVIQCRDARLYGANARGGRRGNGALFKLNDKGTHRVVIHTFSRGHVHMTPYPLYANQDGKYPEGSLLEGKDGNLYGTTCHGGSSDNGTVYKLKRDGSGYKPLHSFSAFKWRGRGNRFNRDGAEPICALIQSKDGFLYGVASGGGKNDFGTIYRLCLDGSDFTVLFTF